MGGWVGWRCLVYVTLTDGGHVPIHPQQKTPSPLNTPQSIFISQSPSPKQEGLRPTVINYNALMEACGKVGDAKAALGFFEQMKVHIWLVCVWFFRCVVVRHGFLNRMGVAAVPSVRGTAVTSPQHPPLNKTTTNKQATGLTPDVVSHSVLIKAHALSGDLDGAFRLLEGMVAEGQVAPTHRTFNPLVDRCARAGGCLSPCLYLCAESYTTPHDTTCTTHHHRPMLHANPTSHSPHTHTARTDLVDRILALMASLPPSLGGPLAPDVVTYNSLLTALAARGETEAAERLVEEMAMGDG